jgi:DNA topoisomerase-3
MYPKVPNILKGLKDYTNYTEPLLQSKLPKSKKVFDNTKVTDHHAIIPTGINPNNLSDNERKVFDLVVRRFIAVFYPDCKISTTTVLGEVDKIEFKVSGRQILEPGWRVLFSKEKSDEEKETDEEAVLPDFVKGERGPHTPDLAEKWTQPPKHYTEATLLRAMETAGKLVDDDELRDALKDNGIGRPSTRAAIIETLFKRNYIRKEKKNLIPTPTGIDLIQTIQQDLLKSAELTGIWEKKLREIEKGNYEARQFLDELKQMVTEVVKEGKNAAYKKFAIVESSQKQDYPAKNTTSDNPKPVKAKSGKSQKVTNQLPAIADDLIGQPCPLCGKGTIIKGKTAYGCSEWKSGCEWRQKL